jgi:alkaline phosphatase D
VDGRRAASRVFPQSIASGDPRPNGIVLWTRLAPDAVPGGVRRRRVKVAYEISRDETFRRPVLRGLAETSPDRDYTVKVPVQRRELKPFQTYYYRFIFQGTGSRAGRFKTLPAPGASLERLRLGYTSCQDYTNGYYNALGYLAQEDVDYVVHLGDYIYETTSEDSFQGGGPPERQFALPSGRQRAETLEDYRFLYKKYKTDPDLQRLHERHAMINIWDDHEFANDCYREYDSDTENEAENRDPQRREAANRAWAEYVPAGVPYEPEKGPLEEIRIYRSFAFGDLAELVMTDERLYRDGPPCGLGTTDKYVTPGCGNEEAPDRTMLGATQKEWFLDKVTNTPRLWKIWGNETMLMQFKLLNTYVNALGRDRLAATLEGTEPPQGAQQDLLPASGSVYVNLDQWDGYQAERREIARRIKDENVKNFVTITGDLHTYLAGYLKEDFDDPLDEPIGTCFMAGSVTSSNLVELATRVGIPAPTAEDLSAFFKASNPHLEFFNSSTHGYNVLEVTPEELTCTMWAVNTIRFPEAALYPLRRFTVPVNEALIVQSPV